MEKPEKYSRNEQLTRERNLRGWSQEDLAGKIGAKNPKNVGRWERGEAIPSSYYQQKLCKLFEMDAAQLGFLKDKVQMRNEQDVDQSPSQETRNDYAEPESEQQSEQLPQDTAQRTSEQNVDQPSIQENSNSHDLAPSLLTQIQILLTQQISGKDSSLKEDLKHAYHKLLVISETRLDFAGVVEVLRKYNGEVAYTRLPQSKAELDTAEQEFDEANVLRTLALLDNNKVWFRYWKATQAFQKYTRRTQSLVEAALRPRSPLVKIVPRYDVMLNPSLDDDPATRKIYDEMYNEMNAMLKMMNKRLR